VRVVTNEVKDWVAASGRSIYQIRLPPPGEHPHADQMASLLMLQQAFGLLALVLSSALVANMISALLAQQIRQIGVMKAIGARTRQVLVLYFGTVLVLSIVALAVALPVGIWAGKIYAGFVAMLLNFNLVNQEIPHWVILLQIGIGLMIPLLAAAYPVYRGGRISVRQAINDYGVERENIGSALIEKLLARWQAFGRPLLLSIGNTFRRQGRLLLTLLTLATGGATFMAALNLNVAMTQTLNVRFESNRYDLEVQFSQPYPVQDIQQATRAIPGVVQAEAWGETEASLMYADGTYGNRFWLLAPPAASTLLNFPVLEGRWLQPDDQNALVISHNWLADNPNSHIKVGDEIILRIDGRETTWHIVGIVRQVAAPPTAFVNYEALAPVTGQTGFASSVRLVTAQHDEGALQAVKRDTERTLQTAGLAVRSSASMFDTQKVLEEHSVVLVSFMMMMTLMSVVVGGLGLMTTMSINVLERTREIGVMRAIGASNLALLRIILIEGGLIGLLSWAGAVLLALPTSYLFGTVFGSILLETPLDFAFNPVGVVIWLAVVLVFSAIASFLPAWNAVELTVRDVLAYE
ncbi:MAG TPA: ABC transporter permease, partial [Phototrophicaceae bacterium]|nr:ABC transporter permease [Phototrophicaceae bacterium]